MICMIEKARKLLFVETVLVLLFCFVILSPGAANESGFKRIFNGKNLDGWEGDLKFWSVSDGTIKGQSTKENPARENTFLVWSYGTVDDFELRLSYRVVGGNSGIQYRSRKLADWVVAGYQADIESGDHWTGALYDEKGRGVLAQRGQKTVIDENGKRKTTPLEDAGKLLAFVKKEDWNEYTITARGNHLLEKINGHVMSEVIDNERAENDRSGILALQVHAGPPMTVQFKDIRLKRFNLKDKKKIVYVAGRPSHGHGTHEHNAGVLLLKSWLDKIGETINAVYLNGWPKDPTAFDNADSIVMFVDGGGGHPMIRGNRLSEIGKKMKQGVGLVMIHYTVEVPKKRGGKELLDWIGGYYETHYSTNPTWLARFKKIPTHPVTRGVKPFELLDEWYFNIRFRPGMKGVTPLLMAVPPEKVRRTKAAKQFPGRAEIVAWCVERPDGGRGFGFTGGHFHKNWGNDNFRKVVLNAIYWTAKLEVPENGVPSTIIPGILKKNLD